MAIYAKMVTEFQQQTTPFLSYFAQNQNISVCTV